MSVDGSAPDGAPREESVVAASLRRVAELTPAQRSVLARLGAAGEPVTAATLAQEAGIRASSVRETLDVLLESGLVRRERMPANGPGRPSYGYVADAPTDVGGPLKMFLDITGATMSVLRATHPEPRKAAQEIGVLWADRLVGESIPDHAAHDDAAYDGLTLAEHMDKIAFFYSALGFSASVSEDRQAVLLSSCPFMRGGQVDGLVCEIHRGMANRLVEQASQGRAVTELTPWVAPSTCRIDVVPVPE